MVTCKDCVHHEVCFNYVTGDEVERCGHFKNIADVVEVEKYNDLRESFVDFVCSGVHNPAPYCKNVCDGCVDSRGWCTYRRCNGFNPDGRGGEE